MAKTAAGPGPAGKKTGARKVSKYTLPADREMPEAEGSDEAGPSKRGRGKAAQKGKSTGNRSAQRNFRVRREAYVKEVERFHEIYVNENERIREEINRLSILVGETPPSDLQPDYDPMAFKLTLPPPLPRLSNGSASSGRGEGTSASGSSRPSSSRRGLARAPPPDHAPLALPSSMTPWSAWPQHTDLAASPHLMVSSQQPTPPVGSLLPHLQPQRIPSFPPYPATEPPPSYQLAPPLPRAAAAHPAFPAPSTYPAPIRSLDRPVSIPPLYPAPAPGILPFQLGQVGALPTNGAQQSYRPAPAPGYSEFGVQGGALAHGPPTAPDRSVIEHGRMIDRLWGASEFTAGDIAQQNAALSELFNGPLIA